MFLLLSPTRLLAAEADSPNVVTKAAWTVTLLNVCHGTSFIEPTSTNPGGVPGPLAVEWIEVALLVQRTTEDRVKVASWQMIDEDGMPLVERLVGAGRSGSGTTEIDVIDAQSAKLRDVLRPLELTRQQLDSGGKVLLLYQAGKITETDRGVIELKLSNDQPAEATSLRVRFPLP
ncbi:MAG: hypothetical protein H0T47_19095 [Planctomycetaceae bacterium]|nr:hypothetical protein [Planctomycetaceae bacterium]